MQYIGLSSTRDIYQEAIETLQQLKVPDLFCTMCIEFAKMELKFQQIERARAILVYGSQQANPMTTAYYWKEWNQIEITHGTEETFREMLRTKRYVEAAYSTSSSLLNSYATAPNASVTPGTLHDPIAAPKPLSNEEAMRLIAAQEGVELGDDNMMSRPATVLPGFTPASVNPNTTTSTKRPLQNLHDVEERVAKLRKAVTGATNNTTEDVAFQNPEQQQQYDAPNDNDEDDNEIDLDDIDAEIEQAAAEGGAIVEGKDIADGNDDGGDNDDEDPNAISTEVKNISTKAIPKAVFGSLVRD